MTMFYQTDTYKNISNNVIIKPNNAYLLFKTMPPLGAHK